MAIQGDSDLQKFLRQRRRQLSKGLTEAEKALKPKRKKKATRKKTTGKKTARKKTTRRKGSRKKAGRG